MYYEQTEKKMLLNRSCFVDSFTFVPNFASIIPATLPVRLAHLGGFSIFITFCFFNFLNHEVQQKTYIYNSIRVSFVTSSGFQILSYLFNPSIEPKLLRNFGSGFQIRPRYVQWTKRLYSLRSFGQLVRISDPSSLRAVDKTPLFAALIWTFLI